MKTFFSLVAAFIAAALWSVTPAAAFDFNASGVIGNGSFASANSSTGTGYSGNMGSASAIAGIGATSFNASQDQATSATSYGHGSLNGKSWAQTDTSASGWSNIDSASGALGFAASGNVGEFQTVNGSDAKASAFGGFGGVFDFQN